MSNVSKCYRALEPQDSRRRTMTSVAPRWGAGELGRREPDTGRVRPHILLPTCHSSGLTIIPPKKNHRQNAGAGSFTQELEYRAEREREPGKASRSVLLSR